MQIKGEPNGHIEYFSIDFENIWLKIPKIKEGMKMKKYANWIQIWNFQMSTFNEMGMWLGYRENSFNKRK